ncbi:hypothetical protein [Bradyrhizobium sp. Gha]|uniref:hypothetical protein n=1 Tax=Bradyrhizobium sp. Gha TaxID=1855318 RepID=UPI0015A61B92|nr:hypothetical protein [Bradyrhizobium sp. Gha]
MDRAEVQLTELLCDACVIADSDTNLHGNVLLYDDIAELADIAEIAKAEEPLVPMVSMVSMVSMTSTHDVEFRIDQFTHSTHDFPPRGCKEQHVDRTILEDSSSICDENHGAAIAVPLAAREFDTIGGMRLEARKDEPRARQTAARRPVRPTP